MRISLIRTKYDLLYIHNHHTKTIYADLLEKKQQLRHSILLISSLIIAPCAITLYYFKLLTHPVVLILALFFFMSLLLFIAFTFLLTRSEYESIPGSKDKSGKEYCIFCNLPAQRREGAVDTKNNSYYLFLECPHCKASLWAENIQEDKKN